MSKPAVRARVAASTYICCTSRMSSLSISFAYVRYSKSLGIWLGPRGTLRDSMHGACGPPYQSSHAARASCSWSMSHMIERLRMSPSSQIRADTRWVSSDSGEIEQYSVQHAAYPPSAFIARKYAWLRGRSEYRSAEGRVGKESRFRWTERELKKR